MDCLCEVLPEPLREPADRFHRGVEERIRRIVAETPRYLDALRRHPRPDPEREALLEASRARLRAIHARGERHLPLADPTPHRRVDAARIGDQLKQRRKGHGR